MNCPYCEKEMVSGNLSGDGRSRLRFAEDGKKLSFGDTLAGVGLLEAAQYKWAKCILKAYYCPRCKKMIIDTAVTK